MTQLTSDITIGNFRFEGVCEVKTKRSMHSFVDTATVVIPNTANVVKEGKPEDVQTKETSTLFKQGDVVKILLGYDDENKEEFTGYVNRINLKFPLEIECMGAAYKLLRTDKYVKEWTSVKVKQVLEFVCAGTDIMIHPDTQDIELKPFRINHQTGYEVLEMLAKEKAYHVFFKNGKLYGCTYEGKDADKRNYWFGWNVAKDDNLKYKNRDEVKVHCTITYKTENGKTQQATYGEKGGVEIAETVGGYYTQTTAQAEARKRAEANVYEGYEGKIRCFLQPYAQPGDAAVVEDVQFPQRDGTYLITSVECDFGLGGGWRNIELGKKLS